MSVFRRRELAESPPSSPSGAWKVLQNPAVGTPWLGAKLRLRWPWRMFMGAEGTY
jgi:hypothetical protein